MRKILIALDYNPSAQKVAETGYSLASSMNAETILLHVIADPSYYASTDYSPIMGFSGYTNVGLWQAEVADDLRRKSKEYLDKSRIHLGDTTIKTIVEEGDFADTILKVAADYEVDFIVIGSHSRRWVEKIVLGSVTEEVLRHATLPLFIVPIKDK